MMKKYLPKIKINRNVWFFIVSILVITGILLTILIIHHQTSITENQKNKSKFKELLKIVDKELYLRPKIGLKYLDSANIIANSTNDNSSKIWVLIYKAKYELENKGSVDQAEKYNDQAWARVQNINDEQLIALVKENRGNCYSAKGEYEKAFISFTDALRYFERSKDEKNLSKVYNNVGIAFIGLEQPPKAIEYFNKSLGLCKKLGDSLTEYKVLLHIGVYYQNIRNYSTSTAYYLKALDGFKHVNDSTGIFSAIINIGYNFLYQDNNIKKAFSYFQEAYEYSIKGNNRKMKIVALINIGDIYLRMNNVGRARDAYEKSLKLSQSEGFRGQKAAVLQSLSEVEKDAGNWKRAFELQGQYYQTRDSSLNGETQKKISELQMKYDNEKRQQEIKIQQQRKDFLILIIILILLSGIISAILLLSRQRIKMKNIRLEKKQLTDEIEFKNKELVTNVMSLLKKNEFIDEATNRLLEIENGPMNEDRKGQILNLIKQMQKGSEEEIWKEFETRFQQVHNAFYEHLLNQFPTLSPSELRLCAFLRLNLSTKEICKITGQNTASLNVARVRLRKKLGLSNSPVNLVTFLHQF